MGNDRRTCCTDHVLRHPSSPFQVVLDVRGVSATLPAGPTNGSAGGGSVSVSGRGPRINWPLLSTLAKGAALALAVDDAPTPPPSASPSPPASTGTNSDAATPEEYRLAGLTSFAFAAALPGPNAALSLGKARATAAAAASGGGGSGSGGSVLSSSATAAVTGRSMAAARGPGGRGGCVALAAVVEGVRLVRQGLARKLCAGKGGTGEAGGGGGDGVVVEEFVIRCAMTGPQAEVYSAVAR